MKVCMFVKNSFEYDARVTKEAETLINAGHQVTVIAIHVPEVTAEREATPEGINVVRVSRVNLGVAALNRIASRYAGVIEARNARLTGKPVDVNKVRELGTLQPPSTATPGDALPIPVTEPEQSATTRPTSTTKLWARVTTPLLRGIAHVARFGYRVVKALMGRQGRALKTWAINRRMIAEGLATGADVFHSHDLNTLYVGHVCKRRTPGARLVYDSHELATERNRMGFWWKAWTTWNERKWIRFADALIVAGPSWISEIEKTTGYVPPIAETVINVPELTEIEPLDLRSHLGIAPGRPILLYQGSIQENRGIEPAIEAITLLDDAVLVVIGYGYYRTALESMVAKRGLGDRVRFFGPIPNRELLAYTATADIGLCNIVNSSLSYYTTLPNKLFEYIMAGIPVIGSDSPEIGRVVKETGVGEVADPVDPASLATAAKTILANPAPYRAATRTATARYNWGVESERLLGVYRRLQIS
ncbi:MAG: glycosyltransferase [Acidimicrobiia bacterium]|nr:glycosyltransferase [Acidimicrobiia bacterium]